VNLSRFRATAACLFLSREPVSRRTYAITGFTLMAFKYAVDATLVWLVTRQTWTPTDYLTPLWTTRSIKLTGVPPGFLLGMVLWTLPFVWVGASLTIRRAIDAGESAWFGLLFFVPICNYLCMLILCVLPTEAGKPGPRAVARAGASCALLVAGLAALGLVLTVFGVYVARSYGVALFLASPFLLGVLTGFFLNRANPQSVLRTLLVTLVVLVATSLLLMLFALEGAVCLLMAACLAIVPAAIGALLGLIFAEQSWRARPAALCVAFVPLLALVEARVSGPATFAVTTTIDIAAPPAVVWHHVVSFSELPPPREFLFRTGVAYPVRARLEGSGAGAVRHCEFSTGAFVEPITVWDEPRRLAFDVVAQPDALEEWSFYERLRPPHLEQRFRSERGQFELVSLADGTTRLEGTTWYTLDVHPLLYWRVWADSFIHTIHQRVLAHIKGLAEAQALCSDH
jgi:hypothetical protein